MADLPQAKNYRQADHSINPIFINRWSPRAMTGEPMSDELLHTLFEAARWAPSSVNEQPWRFLYAKRETPHFAKFYDLMVPGNQLWTDKAAVLIVVTSRQLYERNQKINPTHQFDAGSAWMSLALQASLLGLVAHGMSGFDFEKARTVLHVPDDHDVLAMIALGMPGDPDLLPEKLREREVPSGRKPISETFIEGGF